MIQVSNAPVNTQVVVTTATLGTTNPSDLALYKDGVANATAVTYTNLSGHICNFSFTPTATGIYTLTGEGTVIAVVEVVARTPLSYLKNLEDEAIGSWQWNKQTGIMTMVRQDGTTMATFAVTDNLTTSSRERQ